MKVSIIGTGYVGLVSGTCFAEIGHDITCIDIDSQKISLLKDGKSPIYEPGLTELIERNIKAGRLHFANNYQSCADSKITFLAVGTPSGDDGRANLQYIFDATRSALEFMAAESILVIKSTVPLGTANKIKEIVRKETTKNIYVVNNPEFLKEGAAVNDFMRPDRVVLGFSDSCVEEYLDELYAPLVRQGNPVLKMSNLSAEMTKYAANCFLATKISFINEIARLCDATGADVEEVRVGMGSDVRVGKHFLYPGPGYGGSCFPKDVKALIASAEDVGQSLKIVKAAEQVNSQQKIYMFSKIQKYFDNDLSGKCFAFWGVAFKANTDDIRETPAIDMAKSLVAAGAKVQFYDPVASENFSNYMEQLGINVKGFKDMYECLSQANGLVVMTEWGEFKNPDYHKIIKLLKSPAIFDARNLFDAKKLRDLNCDYFAVGKQFK